MMNIALTDDLQQLLRKRVDNGEFPTEEAVVEEALKSFLNQQPSQEHRATGTLTVLLEERFPGQLLEDVMVLAPLELPRPGPQASRSCLPDTAREPNLFPGE